MIDQIAAARDAALAEIDAADSLESVTALDSRLLGKKGALAQLKTQLGGLATVDEKRTAGQAVNEAMETVAERDRARARTQLGNAATAARVAAERLDLTEFAGKPVRGHAHLVTQAWERLEDVFIGLGFQVAEGPEVETDWHNFEALNMGEGHPARGEFDTLFVDYVAARRAARHARCCARTRRRCRSARCSTSEPPIYIVAPGRVFRRDTPDATHMPVFHQIEGLVVDRDITLADLAGTIEAFTKAFFGAELHVAAAAVVLPVHRAVGGVRHPAPRRLDWLELGGCGMVHPNVLRAGGLDPEEWSGFAFGFGIDRMAKDAPPGRRHPRHVHQRPPLPRAVLSEDRDEDPPVLAQRVRRLRRPVRRRRRGAAVGHDVVARPAGRRRAPRRRRRSHGVVTAEVVRPEQHPDAAKVQRVYVDAGDGVERHVWCGAFNMQPGDVVPLATLGTTMPDGRTIERRGILGIDSEGMLCSADELGLGDDHSGILILPPGTPLGVPYGDALGLDARRAARRRRHPQPARLLGLRRRRPRPRRPARASSFACHRTRARSPPASARTAPVELVDGERCGRFTTTVMSGVRSRPERAVDAAAADRRRHAPDQQRRRRQNYVMLELNQPNHAYDLDTLGGGGFRVRTGARRRADDDARRHRAHVHRPTTC